MLKLDDKALSGLESRYSGIVVEILDFERADLPRCVHCGSDCTANVQVGVIGRTCNIAAATTKFKLLANGPKPGSYFCHSCGKFFD